MTTELASLPSNIMSTVTSGTSAGRQPVADIPLVALLKSIGARVDACCWRINGKDDSPRKESSLAHLLKISRLKMELIMKM
jgi:hypothetical protein